MRIHELLEACLEYVSVEGVLGKCTFRPSLPKQRLSPGQKSARHPVDAGIELSALNPLVEDIQGLDEASSVSPGGSRGRVEVDARRWRRWMAVAATKSSELMNPPHRRRSSRGPFVPPDTRLQRR